MNIKSQLKSKYISAAAVVMVLSSAQLSASDYRLWREQVPLYTNEARTIDIIGGEQGSWFLNEIRTNHTERESVEKSQARDNDRANALSVRNNWFLNAIAPQRNSSDVQRKVLDATTGKLALTK